MTIIVKTPNSAYSGTVLGVSFKNGTAVVTEQTIPQHLGRTIEDVIKQMKEFGYSVEVIDKTGKK